MTQLTREESSVDGISCRTEKRAVLSASRYTSESFMTLEWERVWTRSWLFTGLLSDIPDAGDYYIYSIGRESIVILRDDKLQVQAFYNVCQHRGNRLFTSTDGCVQQIACPYHGWQYRLDGTLDRVPDEALFEPPVDSAKRSLKPVRWESWAGMVWITMDPDAPSLEAYLGPITGNLAGYRFENMVLAKQQTVALEANWKTVRDNFLEQYHVDFIHPQHASLVDCCNSTNTLWPRGHSATQVEGFTTNSRYPLPEKTPPHLTVLLEGLGLDPADFDGRVADIRKAAQASKRELGTTWGCDFSGLSDDQLSDVWQYDIFPNTFMTIQAEELWIYGPRPHPSDPNKCFFDKWTLQIPVEKGCDPARNLTLSPRLEMSAEDERPAREEFDQADVIAGRHSLTITIDQDICYLPDMQAGMHSRGFDHAVLNVEEVRVQHFHDWLDEWMNSDRDE